MSLIRTFRFARLATIVMATAVIVSTMASSVTAQEWADKMFSKREHDFGTVARGAETVYRFEVTNLYKQPMKITGVSSSCGCTTPSVENGTFGTYEKAYVVAKFNTHSHVGRKGATLTVRFAPPYAAEVQLRVHGNIRGDVVFQPGAVQFGAVDQGAVKEQLINVSYAGRQNWQIVDITNDNDHFEVELQEKSRYGGRVTYGLLVRLKDNLPAGYVKDQITVITNDGLRDSQRIPLIVEGRVTPEISVTPEALVLGDVQTGQSVTKKLIVRGKKPFKILDVDCGDDCFTFKTDSDSKRLHFVELTFNPTHPSGPVKVPVRITTDRGPNRGAKLMVTAKVLAPAQEIEPKTETQVESGAQSQSVKTASGTVENARAAGTASK